jgi:hypothetical protein
MEQLLVSQLPKILGLSTNPDLAGLGFLRILILS